MDATSGVCSTCGSTTQAVGPEDRQRCTSLLCPTNLVDTEAELDGPEPVPHRH